MLHNYTVYIYLTKLLHKDVLILAIMWSRKGIQAMHVHVACPTEAVTQIRRHGLRGFLE